MAVGGETLHGDAGARHHVGGLEARSLGHGPPVDEVVLEGGGTAELAGGRSVTIFGLD